MKLIALLFSIYILILPCLPCSDKEDCSDPVQIAVTQTGDCGEHENEDKACGPFCACFCCGHLVSQNFQQPKIAVTKPLIKVRLQNFYDNISLPSDFFGNIWQPPKFS